MITVESNITLYRERNCRIQIVRKYTHYKNCSFSGDLSMSDLTGCKFTDCDLKGTCIDPEASPNMLDCDRFIKEEDFLIGYRTLYSIYKCHSFQYLSKVSYKAPVFSVSHTECHPGLYVCPTIEAVRPLSKSIIAVKFNPTHLHRAGNKYRVKQFTVIGEVS